MAVARIGLVAFWLVSGASFFFATETAESLRVLFWVVLAVHAVEFLAFLGLFRRAPGSFGGHLVRTLIFGFLHIHEARLASAGEAGPS